MQDQIGIHCFVSGRVQGVWFRAGTHDMARALELNGWVRNLSDGRVEVLAFGPQDKITQLSEWLEKGPPRAQVDDLSVENIPWQDHNGFHII